MNTSVDRAIDRLTDSAPHLAQEVVRYTIVQAWTGITFAVFSVIVIPLIALFLMKRSIASDHEPMWAVPAVVFLVIGGLVMLFAAINAFDCVSTIIAPEGAAIVRALPQ